MYLSHRLRLRLDGLLVARGLRLHQLQEVLVYFLGIYPEVSALADAEDKALLARARDDAQALQELILTQAGPPPVDQLPIPDELTEALRLLKRQADLRSVMAVNYLIDYLITNMANQIQSQAESVDLDERGEAAQRLEEAWFADGRAFLKLDSRRQWAETQRRFERPTQQLKDDLQLLRLHNAHARILAFNNWFARIQGIDPTRPPLDLDSPSPPALAPAPDPKEIEARADALVSRLIALATALWPSATDPAHAHARALLLSKIIEKLQEPHR